MSPTRRPTDPWPARPPAEPPWLPPGHPGLTVPAAPAGRPAGGPGVDPASGDNAPPGPERAPGDDGPSPVRRGPLVAALAVLVVVALVGAAVVVALVRPPVDETAAPTRSTTTAPPPSSTRPSVPAAPPGSGAPEGPGGSTSDPAVVQAEVAVLSRFVEQVRGRPFRTPVVATVMDPSAFRTEILGLVESDQAELARQGELLRAAGLVPPGYDVVAGTRSLLGDGVLGFYEPATGRLVVRGGADFSAHLRQVLVHELTHALDDQHADLDRVDEDGPDPVDPAELEAGADGDWAFLALVEGSAKWVEGRYGELMDADQRAEVQREMAALGASQQQSLAGVPLVLARLQMSPYDYGAPFVSALVERDGPGALDAAYARPPATSEQIVDPDRYRSGEDALAVAPPPADGEVLSGGTLGQVMTGFVLRGAETNELGVLLDPSADPRALQDLMDRLARGEVDLDRLLEDLGGGTGGFGPLDSPSGWGGDRYVVYRPAAGGVCLRADWRMDTPAALDALAGELSGWAAGAGAEIARPAPDLVRATRCVPA